MSSQKMNEQNEITHKRMKLELESKDGPDQQWQKDLVAIVYEIYTIHVFMDLAKVIHDFRNIEWINCGGCCEDTHPLECTFTIQWDSGDWISVPYCEGCYDKDKDVYEIEYIINDEVEEGV